MPSSRDISMTARRRRQPPGQLHVCLSHGRDERATATVRNWLERYSRIQLEVHQLSREAQVGGVLPRQVEAWGREGDLAIVLATPDDTGRPVEGKEQQQSRARQNIWMEYGWFWGRLGTDRTALLVMSKSDVTSGRLEVERPSNIAGINYIPFSDYRLGGMRTPETAAWRLDRFLRECWWIPAGDVTEVRAARHDPRTRDQEWAALHQSAKYSLVITGIAMGKLVDDLEAIFALMGKRSSSLRLTLMPVDSDYLRRHEAVFTNLHRDNTVVDNTRFYEELASKLVRRRALAERVTLAPYRGVPPFAVTVADGGQRSSRLLAQPFVPRPKNHPQEHPRFDLVARAEDGVFKLYWGAVRQMIARTKTYRGRDSILSYVKGLRSEIP